MKMSDIEDDMDPIQTMPTHEKSRTAEDFPFHKLSPGALRRVKRGPKM
jgi:hypothetical protein